MSPIFASVGNLETTQELPNNLTPLSGRSKPTWRNLKCGYPIMLLGKNNPWGPLLAPVFCYMRNQVSIRVRHGPSGVEVFSVVARELRSETSRGSLNLPFGSENVTISGT